MTRSKYSSRIMLEVQLRRSYYIKIDRHMVRQSLDTIMEIGSERPIDFVKTSHILVRVYPKVKQNRNGVLVR